MGVLVLKVIGEVIMFNRTFIHALILAVGLMTNATAALLLPDGISQLPQPKQSPDFNRYDEGLQALSRT